MLQTYGMTEAASQICATPIEGERKAGSVGVAVGVEVRVVAHGKLAPPGVVGDIEIKGPTVIARYESAALDGRFRRDGWLHTGDLGYFNEDDYLFLVGRDDDVINRGGEKIYPLDVELVLAEIPGVASVAVVAAPDEVFGQVPVAFVQPEDESPTLAELVALAKRVRRVSCSSLAKVRAADDDQGRDRAPRASHGQDTQIAAARGAVSVVWEERL